MLDAEEAVSRFAGLPGQLVAALAVSVRLVGPAGTFLAGRLISALSAWAAGVMLALIVYAPRAPLAAWSASAFQPTSRFARSARR